MDPEILSGGYPFPYLLTHSLLLIVPIAHETLERSHVILIKFNQIKPLQEKTVILVLQN